jgi:hypothetical protein
MNKLLAVSVMVASAFPTLVLAEGLDDVMTALSSGKTSLELRLRAEQVEDSGKKENANAQTLRTVLGYKTGDYKGVTGFIEFENVSDFGQDDYNDNVTTSALRKTFPVIADVAVTQVNQAYLEGYGLRYGTQKLVFDNARFVGDVGWRQNDQTFNGLSYTNKVLIPATTFTLAYINKVNPIGGMALTRNIQAPMANIRYSKVFENWGITASGFYYAVDEKETVGAFSPKTSFQHTGARVEGSIGNALYEVSFAKQGDYKDGVATVDANYRDLQLGYKFGPVTVKIQDEVLEPGFKTPLATLHAFNGWADRFLTTPAGGLEDTNLKLLAKYWGLNFVVAAHSFKAETGGVDFGQEVNFSVMKPVNRNLSLMLKYADYQSDDTKLTLAGTAKNTDLKKTWLQVGYKF